jgi:hypothetical protein
LPNLAKKGIEYTKVQESDLPDILKRFDDAVTLIEELSGVYEQLEKYSELKSEIVFYEKLENTTVFISLLAIRILGIIFAC